MVIGQDLSKVLKKIIAFEHEVIKWGDSQILTNRTKLIGKNKKQYNSIFQLATESKTVREAMTRVKIILYAHYESAS